MKNILFNLFCAASLLLGAAQPACSQQLAGAGLATGAGLPPNRTWYYDVKGQTVKGTDNNIDHRSEMSYEDSVGGKLRIYYPSGKLRREVPYRDLSKGVKYGVESSYYESGEIKSRSEYGPKGPVGNYVQFYRNGAIRISTKPKNGFGGGNSSAFEPDGKPFKYNPLKEELPVYSEGKGGLAEIVAAIQKAVQYPVAAQQADISGRVFAGFMVDDAGFVSNVHILETPSVLFNDTVVQAINSLGRFTPGEMAGERVDVFFTVPVTFRLQ